MNKKEDFAHAMGTLLSLDRVMVSDLMNLKPETLAKMYTQYIQNAKDANHKLEQVKQGQDIYVRATTSLK